MTSRFDVERAMKASDLPRSAKSLMWALLSHADVDPVNIPAKFTPSLSTLATETSMGRTTVQRVLRDLETAGWIIRDRPPVEQSRKHVRTRYRLVVPVGAQGTHPHPKARSTTDLPTTQARSTTDLELGPPRTQARSTTDLELGPPRTPSILTNPSNQSIPRARADEAAAVIEALRDRTGRTVDEHHAGLVVDQLLDGRRNGEIRTTTVRYLIGAIRNDADPGRFLPTPIPPPYQRDET